MLGKLVRNFITGHVGTVISEKVDEYGETICVISVPGAPGDAYDTTVLKRLIGTDYCTWELVK